MYDEHQSLGAPSGKKRGPSEDSPDAVEAKKAKSNTPTSTAGFPTSVAAPHPGMDPTQAAAAAAAWSQQQQQQQQQQPPWAGQQWGQGQGQGQWGQQGYGYGNYGSYSNYAYPQQ